LFTDIQGSTELVQKLGIERWQGILGTHYEILRREFEAHDGREVNTEGDAFFVAFPQAREAIAACAAGQKALYGHPWPDDAVIRVRMGLHTGEAAMVGGDYMGIDIHRAARIASSAHGGQVVLSDSTRALVSGTLPEGVDLIDLGEHRLKDLAEPERIWQLCIEGLPREFPALKSLDFTPNNLPTQLTSFVGRDKELAEGLELLNNNRLLTLTGPGGMGKTRLSLQIAAEATDGFKHGVFFVPLAPIVDPELVPSTILQVLGKHEIGAREPQEALIEYLRDKQMLLVLDNFEQILPGAKYVGEILKASPDTKVIASSRAALKVYGEQEFPIPPLGVPDMTAAQTLESFSQFEAVKLFIERAVSVKPDFLVTNENAPAIAGITELVDGLPLAIELAAARIKLLPPQAMFTRLQTHLGELGGGARDLPERQQTLRGAIAWSHDLLDPGAKTLFARLAVFVRGGALEQIEAVCGPAADVGGDVLNSLETLVEHNLVRPAEQEDQPRFFMLHVIREFALDQLAAKPDAKEIHDRHANTFVELAEAAAPQLMSERQKWWLDRLELEHDNFRGAYAWAAEQGDPRLAARLLAGLWRYAQMRGHLHEARQRAEEIVVMPGLEEHVGEQYRAFEAAGGIVYWQGEFEAAAGFYESALTAARSLGDKRVLAEALYNAAFPSVLGRVRLEQGEAYASEALALYREVGDEAGIGKSLWVAALTKYYGATPEFPAAIQLLVEARDIFRKLGDRFNLGWDLYVLGLCYISVNDLGEAEEAMRESLQLFSDVDDVSGPALVLNGMAMLASARGDRDRAARLDGARAGIEARTGIGLVSTNRLRAPHLFALTEDLQKTNPEAFAAGEGMSVKDAIALALSNGSAEGKSP
jgi:predicted ATPase/class 3 adenylate cyclase